jgi:hypothetical protein
MIKEAKEAQDLFGKGDLEGLGTESSPKTNLAYILTKICVHETEYLSSFLKQLQPLKKQEDVHIEALVKANISEWTKYICTFERTSITGRTI